MEGNNVQIITLTSPESASSTSHLLNTSSNLMAGNYSNSSGVLSQDSSSSFSNSIAEDNSSDCKRKKFKSCSSESPKIISKFKPFEEKLEERLWSVLCCAVCLELPLTTIYQCSKGHLICISCFHHLMADSKLKEENATCATCRCIINRDSVYRNLAVEKAIRELPANCQHCNKMLTRMQLYGHENDECEERPVSCCYNRLGCPWRGPAHEKINHEDACQHPNRSGHEVLQYLEKVDKTLKEDKDLLDSILNLISTSDRFHIQDAQFKSFRTDEYIHRLFFETAKFQAFELSKSQLSNDNQNGFQFVVKARVNDDQKDPTQSCERKMTYQLVLKSSKITSPIKVHYFITNSPYDHDEIKLKTKIKVYSYEFSDNNCESPYTLLPLLSSGECNRLLSFKVINFRICMFLEPKQKY